MHPCATFSSAQPCARFDQSCVCLELGKKRKKEEKKEKPGDTCANCIINCTIASNRSMIKIHTIRDPPVSFLPIQWETIVSRLIPDRERPSIQTEALRSDELSTSTEICSSFVTLAERVCTCTRIDICMSRLENRYSRRFPL